MMLAILITLFSVQLLVVLVLMIGYRMCHQPKPNPSMLGDVEGISFIIPFHNEEDRIGTLIESINNAMLPERVEFIFVDDHSTDRTVAFLSSHIQTPFVLLRNENKKGKKNAIRTGVRGATYDAIVTLDADVSFSPVYPIEMGYYMQSDLVIFPVRMNKGGLVSRLGSFEFSFLQLLTFGLAGFGVHLLSNGANMGFRRSVFLELDAQRSDYDVPSGDDIFLLHAMKKAGRRIMGITNSELLVDTTAPDSVIGLIQQRKRWFGKMTKMIDLYSFFSVFLLIISQIGLFYSIIAVFHDMNFLIPIGLKFFSELVADVFANRLFSLSRVLLLLIHQLWYPIYLFLLLLPFGVEKRWIKGEINRTKN